MARHASRAAYASDVSACFPTRIVGLVLAVADAQSRGLEHFAPPRHRRRLRRSYRPRRLVGQRAAAADERSAKVAEDAATFLKDCAVLRNERARRVDWRSAGAMLPDTPSSGGQDRLRRPPSAGQRPL